MNEIERLENRAKAIRADQFKASQKQDAATFGRLDKKLNELYAKIDELKAAQTEVCARCESLYTPRPRTNICENCQDEVGGELPIIDEPSDDDRKWYTCSKSRTYDETNVEDRWSFGCYAGRLCVSCCGSYRDNCGLNQPQGTQAEIDDQIESSY